MKNDTGLFFPLYQKELLQLITTSAVLPAASFLLFASALPFLFSFPTIAQYYQRLPMLMTIFIPLLASGSWANEYKTGTIGFLITLPVPEFFLTGAKYLALLTAYLGILCLSVPVPLMLAPYTSAGVSEILAIVLAVFLYGAAALAMALFFSNLFTNTVASFLCTGAVLLFLNTAHIFPASLELSGALQQTISFLSFSRRYETLNRGIIDSRDILFFIFPGLVFTALDSACIRFRRKR